MNRIPVVSSHIVSVGYESTTRTLEIEFTDGGIYQYFNITPLIHSGLMSAPSKGEYLDRVIKKGGYRYRKIK